MTGMTTPEHRRWTGRRRRSRRVRERRGIAIAIVFGLVALLCDRACDEFKRRRHKRWEALADGGAHIATALAVSLPAAPFVGHRRRFVLLAAASAVAIDLDHLVAARTFRLIPSMSMPNRPPSHSVLTIGVGSYAAERLWPGTQSGLAMALGLGSHLLRDLATGGAPLFIPRRIVAITRPPVASMMFALGLFGRWHARYLLDPERPRRSNPIVLAPEALVVSSRAIRAARAIRQRPPAA